MLKVVAAVLMLIDHIGLVFFPGYIFPRLIGRLAMPIFAYGIAIGFEKTQNLKKYICRMGIFALISQVPYTIMIMPTLYGCTLRQLIHDYGVKSFFLQYNIGITFLFSLAVMYFYKEAKENKIYYVGLGLLVVETFFIQCDYGIYGVLMPLCFYEFYIKQKNINKTIYILLCLSLLMFQWGIKGIIIQLPSVASIWMIETIKSKPTPRLKYFFYLFYPVHMLILAFLKEFIK